MSEATHVQWFPGHMAKTRRIMASNMKLVDAVVEITDARIPYSSRNPEIKKIVGAKPRLVLLNKADSADANMTDRWIEYYKKQGVRAIATDCRSGRNVNRFYSELKELLKEDISRWEAKGMTGRPIRIMIVGIPNVGKSSFINRLAGAKTAKVEDRPGVTRGKQWVSLDEGFELLDMPGVLWPKFEDKLVGERLAFTGAVKDRILDTEFLACRLLEFLKDNYNELLEARYGITTGDIPPCDDETAGCVVGYEILERIGRKRGFLVSGGEINTERAANTVLDEYRSGKIGRMTLADFDSRYREKYNIVCGCDEAGRGPLAGDVFAAAVVFDKDTVIDGINDSKKLSEKKREKLFDEIKQKALYWSIKTASVEEIESINILNCAMLAMKRAVEDLPVKPDICLIDGNKTPQLDTVTEAIVGGDGKSQCIAAASILAKVARDRYMLEVAKQYPQWQFEKHKGYGTKLHYEMIDKYGASPVHRQSFLKKYYAKLSEKQQENR